MITLHEAARKVLEAWQTSCYGKDSHQKAMLIAMTDLREALAQQGEPIGKLVIDANGDSGIGIEFTIDRPEEKLCVGQLVYAAAPAAQPTCKQDLQVPTVKESLRVATGWVAPKDRYAVPVLFNPYTGEPRDVRDVQSDPQGILLVPPGKVEMLAAAPATSLYPEQIKQDISPMNREEIRLARSRGYDAEDAPEAWDFEEGVRAAERHHGIGADK